MIFDLLSLIPEELEPYLNASVLGRARAAGLITVRLRNIRDFASDRHHVVDDLPYGGGDGMVMMAGPVVAALESLPPHPAAPVIILNPKGRVFNQDLARELALLPRLILVCGRYEGIDQRVSDLKADMEISLGDFILTGGELAALSVIDAVSRLLPGVLGGENSAAEDSFSSGLLEYPHYTRPAEFRGLKVPDILLSGHHANIARWRRRESLRLTEKRRPDLLDKTALSREDIEFLDSLRPPEGRADN
ncbi:MAG: tRNA (guanosine(37)-N1)-methyltransferase TrmD [Desulfarculales bacterium]|jgi:tRNA (guanine37-N1)-methyltransferase|nr:tRNA (guanosine(37)-N1)-methyltransferase TrmD [Desulfarculales bacterium]